MFKKIKCVLIVIATVFLFIALGFLNKSPVLSDYTNLTVYTERGSYNNGANILSKNYSFIKGVRGESYIIKEDNFSAEDFFHSLNGKILFTENTAEGIGYYGFSPKIKYGEKIKGRKVNIHLYVKENYIKVGFPILYGAY